MTIPEQPYGPTHHAIEAAKHLWMVPFTIMGAPEPNANFGESIAHQAHIAAQNQDESFWYFTTAALAYAHMAAKAIVNTLAGYDNRCEVGEIDSDLIDENLDNAGHAVSMATASWFRAAQSYQGLDDAADAVSKVADHPSGFDCTRNISQSTSWFHCAYDTQQEAPCLNCPSIRRLRIQNRQTEFDQTIEFILEMSSPDNREPDLEELGPLPDPENPAAHCLKAIQHLAELAKVFDVGSTNHRSIAYAAIAANTAITQLRHLGHHVQTEEEILDIADDADPITAHILSGETVDQNQEFEPPDEYDECIVRTEVTTGQVTYLCAPNNPPADWGALDFDTHNQCRLCPMRAEIPERAMDRALKVLAELSQNQQVATRISLPPQHEQPPHGKPASSTRINCGKTHPDKQPCAYEEPEPS